MKTTKIAIILISSISSVFIGCKKENTSESAAASVEEPAQISCTEFRNTLKKIGDTPEEKLRSIRSSYMVDLHRQLSAEIRKGMVEKKSTKSDIVLKCMPEVSFPKKGEFKTQSTKPIEIKMTKEDRIALVSGVTTLGGLASAGILVETSGAMILVTAPVAAMGATLIFAAAATTLATYTVVDMFETKETNRLKNIVAETQAWRLIRIAADFKAKQIELEKLTTNQN